MDLSGRYSLSKRRPLRIAAQLMHLVKSGQASTYAKCTWCKNLYVVVAQDESYHVLELTKHVVGYFSDVVPAQIKLG